MGEARNRMLQGLPPRGVNPNQPQQINVDLTGIPPRTCECGSDLFMVGFRVIPVSALVSPTGQAAEAQVPILVCMKCQKPFMAGKKETEGDGVKG